MENAKPLQFVGYTRVSTAGQVVDGVSLEAQVARIRAWAASTGAVSLGLFEDAGVSGSSRDGRPGLAAALELVKKRKGTLVVYSLSRMARSTKDAINIAEDLERAGANLVSLTETLDTTSAMGFFFFTMMAALAKMERDLVSERTKMAMAHKRAKHERTSNRIPFGWDLAPDGAVLTRNEFEQAVLGRMRGWRDEGMSLRRICRRLEVEGVLTKLGHTKWDVSTVFKLLRK